MAYKNDDELEIIRRVCAGQTNEFCELVRRHEPRIRRLCCSILIDKSTADDAAQETFIRAYKAIARFRGDSAFISWLYKIAINTCRDFMRKTSARPSLSWEALSERQRQQLEAERAAPPDSAIASEHSQTIHLVLAALPAKQREILLLREVEGLSYEEIAQVMKCTIDSVKARLKRTREKLDDKLRHLYAPRSVSITRDKDS